MSLRKYIFILGLIALPVYAQETPVGLWKSIDDKTGKPRAEIRITEADGVLSGKIEKGLGKETDDAVCDKCTDDRKDKKVLGMEIIRKAKKQADANVWADGEILDPDNGKTYRLKLTPLGGGKKLQVRGYIGPFYRTQVWQRAQ